MTHTHMHAVCVSFSLPFSLQTIERRQIESEFTWEAKLRFTLL